MSLRTAGMRSAVTLVVLALMLAAAAPAVMAVPTQTSARAGEVIPGSYIVVLADGASIDRVAGRHFIPGHAITGTYHHALLGFSANLTAAAANRLAEDPRVETVEPDRWWSVTATQTSPPWGLDRTDERELPLSGMYDYATTGLGVTAYVIDSGVRSTHEDVAGRVMPGFTAFTDRVGTEDCNGHGTHVAGTLAGTDYGVAKDALIVPVRVMQCDGNGSARDILRGLDWVAQDHASGQLAVANMSIAAPGTGTVVDEAVEAGIADGITYVVAAGNENVDACGYSPGNVADALTVGASARDDVRAPFSNYGTCLDLFAPGVGITSAWHTSTTAQHTQSGTSMAAPHVSGVAARYLEYAPSATPAQVATAITSSATPAVIADPGQCSPPNLLYAPASTETAWIAARPLATDLANWTPTSPITYGASSIAMGRLTADGVAVSCEPVQLQRRARGTSHWKTITARGTDSDGRVAIAVSPRVSTYYRLRYLGDPYEPSTSVRRLVGVRTRVGGALNDAVVKRGAIAKLSGAVRPSHVGQPVVLQRYRDGAWRNVTSKNLNRESRYAFRLRTTQRGTFYYRATMPGHTDHLRGVSRARKLIVE